MTKIDPNKMMAQLGQMQAQMEKAQEELETTLRRAQRRRRRRHRQGSGALEVAEITIRPEAIDPDDPEMLQDLLVSAVNGGDRRAQQLQQQKMMGQLGGLGGLGLPGM